MAERRMFAKKIIDSDAFLDMPLSTQALYFHLSMRADDDGFIDNPKRIQRTIGCADDDMRLLIAKQYIIPFESGIVVIKHWKIHNYIQNDRYIKTLNVVEKEQLGVAENKEYFLTNEQCIQDVSKSDTQVRLGKNNIEEREYKEKENSFLTEFAEVWKEYPNKKGRDNALKDYIKARKEGVSKDDIVEGIRRYKAQIEANKTEAQFIMHGSTWFHQRRWTDEYEKTQDSKGNYERKYESDPYENIYGEE